MLLNHQILSDSLWPHGLQHTRLPCPSPSPKVCPGSCPLHQWCQTVISSSDALLSFCPQSLPASGTFPMSHLFTSNDQNTGASTSASVLPMSFQGWFPLRLTGLICCPEDSQEFSPPSQFKGISSLALCLLYSPALTIVRDYWEHQSLDYTDLSPQSNVSAFQHTV